MADVSVGGLELHPSLVLSGDMERPAVSGGVVHGLDGGVVVQVAPAPEAGWELRLAATDDGQGITGYWTAAQIEGLRAMAAARMPVELVHHGRSWQVLVWGGWDSLAPVWAEAPRGNDDWYTGELIFLVLEG